MKLGMQISHFGSRKDDQPKNQVLKWTPNIEKASLSKLDIDLRLPNLYRWYGQRSIQIIYFFSNARRKRLSEMSIYHEDFAPYCTVRPWDSSENREFHGKAVRRDRSTSGNNPGWRAFLETHPSNTYWLYL